MYSDIEASMGAKIESATILKSGWAGEIVSLKFAHDTQKYLVKTYGSSKNALPSLKQEWAGLNFLDRAMYPVPKPILRNFEAACPYLLMEEIDGENLWTVYEKASSQDQQNLLSRFIGALFHLHALDCSIAGSQFAGKSTPDFIEEELCEIERLAQENDIQNLAPIVAWLRDRKNTVAAERPSILHRDYHPWNVLVDVNGQIHVIDLVWGVGDYRFDLAWLCTLMERSGFQDFSQAAWRKYQEYQQTQIQDFEYFKVLSTLRWLANVTVSLKTGESLNQSRSADADAFFLPLINRAVSWMNEITGGGE